MLSIYPTNFASLNGESYSDKNGELTKIGQIWIDEIEKLHMSQISLGMENLRFKDNPNFAPSAVEFSAFCIKFSATECANEILEYIQSSKDSDWWWRTEVAFNVFDNLGYAPARNQNDSQIVKDIEKEYRKLDLSNLKPIPEKAILIQHKEPSKIDRDRSKFQALMNFAILRLRPDFFGSSPTRENYPKTTGDFLAKFAETCRPPEQLCDFIAEQKGMTKNADAVSLFAPHKSNELMVKWYRGNQPNMTDFLRNEGFSL